MGLEIEIVQSKIWPPAARSLQANNPLKALVNGKVGWPKEIFQRAAYSRLFVSAAGANGFAL